MTAFDIFVGISELFFDDERIEFYSGKQGNEQGF